MIGSFFMPVGAFGEYDNKLTKEVCKPIKMIADVLMSLTNSRRQEVWPLLLDLAARAHLKKLRR